MSSPGSVLRPTPGLAVEAFEDALLIWDQTTGRLHHLDLLAAMIWDELDGRSLGEIAAAMAEDLGATPDLVRRDVLTLGDTLLTEGLVRDAGA